MEFDMRKSISIPAIGCGKDKEKWKIVKLMLGYIFQESKIKITVCLKPVKINMAAEEEIVHQEADHSSDDEYLRGIKFQKPRMPKHDHTDKVHFKTMDKRDR